MRYLLAFFLLTCLSGCFCFRGGCGDGGTNVTEDGTVHLEEITHIVMDYELELRAKYRLHLEDSNVYYNPYINTIVLKFVSEDIIEMSDARKLIVDLVEGFLAKLNEDPIVSAQFDNFPFRSQNLEVYITFDSFFGRFVDPYYMMWICMEDDMVYYYLFDTKNQDKNCWHYRTEPYYKSREIVVYQRNAEQQEEESFRYLHRSAFGPDRYIPNP